MGVDTDSPKQKINTIRTKLLELGHAVDVESLRHNFLSETHPNIAYINLSLSNQYTICCWLSTYAKAHMLTLTFNLDV